MKKFLITSGNISRDSVMWNMGGSLLMAFQSVIMLMILTRTLGIVEAGIFTIAYANANLFLTVGKYGVRSFQVSDVKREYSFSEYLATRWSTTITMLVVSVIYIIYTGTVNDYTVEKSLIIIFMCLFKSIDSMEDVFCGFYQQNGRLDIAAKILTVRLIMTIIVYALGIVILQNQLTALMIAIVFTGIVFFLFVKWTLPFFEIQHVPVKNNNIIRLLRMCFPVFLGTFLAFYIGNAPKYAIDAQLSDEIQACYGFIAMPVFVIGLLNGFIFNPMLFRISQIWSERKIKEFCKLIVRQCFIILGITVACVIGAYLIGVPVLSILYNTDLSDYKAELLILLVGGGFLGLSGFLSALITVIRYQRSLVLGYGVAALGAFYCSGTVVASYGVMGAAVLYMTLMALLCVCFATFLIIGIKKSLKS